MKKSHTKNLRKLITAALLFIVLLRDQRSWIHQRNPAIAMGVVLADLLLPALLSADSLGELIRTLTQRGNMLSIAGAAVMVSVVAAKCRNRGPKLQNIKISSRTSIVVLPEPSLSSRRGWGVTISCVASRRRAGTKCMEG